MGFVINKNTKIITKIDTKAVRHGIHTLERDLVKACGDTDKKGIDIYLVKGKQEKECFWIHGTEHGLEIQAADDLGFLYGIYHISRTVLRIWNFWFWNDQTVEKKEEYLIEENYQYQSTPFAVKFRGWFINDEVLLHTWSVDRKKDKPWELAFETLLRCGGNMVIPGTDRNSEIYRSLASDMGLFITHHHAEPLGAKMFSRAYPKLNPSYDEHPDKFQKLWREGIEEQKDRKIVWNIGFRGQGDCPFWSSDPRYQTSGSRGELMSSLIQIQYDMIKQFDSDGVCCTNLYGETMELYQEGFLKLPDEVIKIWADNGFGKMVTRRQGNHNPRITALPNNNDQGAHGIYYHVSFYDLQAANHMTMLPNSPEFVKGELTDLLNKGVKDYWIINCSNIKPHVYYLDFIAHMWREGSLNIGEHRKGYVESYYKEHAEAIAKCLEDYPKYALAYGRHEDEHAGEQFSNHVARMLISQYMKDKNSPTNELLWATDANSLEEQINWYKALCKEAYKNYGIYMQECEQVSATLLGETKVLFDDTLLLQAYLHYNCFFGAYKVCEALLYAFKGDYQRSFYHGGQARNLYRKANEAMRSREHGKWHKFYENECLTDMKQTAWVLEGFMSYVRNLGDGPHFYQWQRDFLYSEEDKRVMLIMNMENHLTDEEIFALMEEKWGN